MTERFDLVVLGAGSAGCVVAARASEDPSLRVLLVEDGPDPQPIPDIVSNPKRQPELVLESPFVRRYAVRRPIDGSTYTLLSGRLTGGGSSVNNMSVLRPFRIDFDAWSRFGGPAWSYDAMLPLMRSIESDPHFGSTELHGDSGPLHLDRAFTLDSAPADPRLAALVEASAAMGLPICPDLNVPAPLGVCASPYAIKDGSRQSTAVAWLEPARGRPNLTIRADTQATRLILDGSRVRGVELHGPDGPAVVEADRIVVSSGVFHSPQLLMLSGIGRPEVIEAVGLRVTHPLDGVGENYQDHCKVFLTFEGGDDARDDDAVPKVRLVTRSDPSLEHADLQVFMRPAIAQPGQPPTYPWSVHLLENRARGRVTLATASATDLPLVQPALLEHPDDVEAMTNGLRFVRDLVAQPALRRYYGAPLEPGPSDDLADYVRRAFTSYYHGVGTCRIGPADDPGAVVDGRLRVHGLDNLWVADASVVPVLPHANTNVSAILMGEIAARSLREAA